MRWANDWLLLPQRLALHEPSATAVLADVHLGYSAARQRLGDAVPLRTCTDEMQPLAVAARTHAIRQVIVAGDLFERGHDAGLFRDFLGVLAGLAIELRAVVPGNHDRGIESAADVFPDGYDLAGWHICHGDQPVKATHAVMGHWHPAIRVRGRKHACFLTLGTHLILPAFSLDAAGADIRRDPRWRSWEAKPC